MVEESSGEDGEFRAMHQVYIALQSLDSEAQARVLNYVSARLGIALQSTAARSGELGESEDSGEQESDQIQDTTTKFGSLAELFDAAQPKTGAERALVAGYWLQVCQGNESFDGFSVNRDLKHLGQGLPNVTSAIDTLKAQKPALALQLKKSGKSKQARKLYKITVAGIKAVEAMIRG